MKKTVQLVAAFLLGGLVVFSLQYVDLGQGRLTKNIGTRSGDSDNQLQLPSKVKDQQVTSTGSSTSNACVFTPKIEADLSATSPNGSRTVSASDDMVVFDLAAAETVEVGSLKVVFNSDSDFDIADLEIKAMDGTVMAGSSVDSSSEFERIINFDQPFEIEGGTVKTIRLNVNSSNLIDEDAGQDDPVTIELLEIYDTDGMPVMKKPASGGVLSNTVKY